MRDIPEVGQILVLEDFAELILITLEWSIPAIPMEYHMRNIGTSHRFILNDFVDVPVSPLWVQENDTLIHKATGNFYVFERIEWLEKRDGWYCWCIEKRSFYGRWINLETLRKNYDLV